MLKTFTYIGILLMLVLGIYFFVIRKDENPYSQQQAGFKIKDTAAIQTIFMASSEGQSITIERGTEGWLVNKKYRALNSMIDLLMYTFVNQEPLYPVPKSALDNVIKLMSADAVKVELYDKNGEKMRVFYVGGSAANGNGTNMLMDNSSTPYVVQTPAFNGDLRPRYTTDLADWRDRVVFDVPADRIQSISVQYALEPKNSYKVVKASDGKVQVIANEGAIPSKDSLNENRVKSYLSFFEKVYCEGYLNGQRGMDSAIVAANKLTDIAIATVEGKQLQASIYWMPINRRSKNLITPNEEVPSQFDADRLYLVGNNGIDTMLIQMQTFKKLMRKLPEFYAKDQPAPAKPQSKP